VKLTDLDARFIKHVVGVAPEYHGRPNPNGDGTTQWGGFPCDELHRVETLAEADGLSFLCPMCFAANGGRAGTHSIIVAFRGKAVPEALFLGSNGVAARWDAAGNGLDDLSLKPSILLYGGCKWHGFVTNGDAA
jgi:hypothetical protein